MKYILFLQEYLILFFVQMKSMNSFFYLFNLWVVKSVRPEGEGRMSDRESMGFGEGFEGEFNS